MRRRRTAKNNRPHQPDLRQAEGARTKHTQAQKPDLNGCLLEVSLRLRSQRRCRWCLLRTGRQTSCKRCPVTDPSSGKGETEAASLQAANPDNRAPNSPSQPTGTKPTSPQGGLLNPDQPPAAPPKPKRKIGRPKGILSPYPAVQSATKTCGPSMLPKNTRKPRLGGCSM